MALTKAALRESLSRMVGDWFPLTASASGAADGATFITTQLDGYGNQLFQGNWLLVTSGTHGGATPKYRRITTFAGATPATFTLAGVALGSAIASAVTAEMHVFRPDLYSESVNRAIRARFPDLGVQGVDSTYTVGETATITTSSVAAATVITVPAGHKLVSGQTVTITGHTGSTPAIAGDYLVTVTGTTTFTIPVTVTVGGTGGTMKRQRFDYGLPGGLTSDMIYRVMQSGDAPFANIPFFEVRDWSFSADGTRLLINRGNTFRYVDLTDTRTLYLFYEKYLTLLDKDSTFGALTTDTTAKVEVVADTNQHELLLLWSKYYLFDLLAAAPGNDRRAEHLTSAKEARAEAVARTPDLRMARPENPWVA